LVNGHNKRTKLVAVDPIEVLFVIDEYQAEKFQKYSRYIKVVRLAKLLYKYNVIRYLILFDT